MSWREDALRRLDAAVERRRLSRWRRLRSHPLSTLRNSAAMRLLQLLARRGHWFHKTAATVFGEAMTVIVPTGYCDVWLYGAVVDCDAEVRLTRHLLSFLKEGEVFFDVGACLGYYSLLASRLVGAGGSVCAFEPSPEIAGLLRRNLRGKANARVIEKAVDATAGAAEFYVAPLPFLGTSSLRADWQEEHRTTPVGVRTTSLDEFCQAAGIFPDFIKLDVEGAEDRALRGARGLLSREPAPAVALEVFMPMIASDRTAVRFLRELGYHAFAIADDGGLAALEDDEALERHLARLKQRYALVQDSPNDFDNLIFKRGSP